MNARRSTLSRILNSILLLALSTVLSVCAKTKSNAPQNMNQHITHMQEEKKEKTSKMLVLTRAEKEQQQQKSTQKVSRHRQKRIDRIAKAKQDNKTLSTMDYQDLKVKKDEALARNDKEIAAKYLEQMLKLCEDINTTAPQLMLELADLYFDMGELPKAELLYAEFTHLYPGNDAIAYASYKAIVCSFYATLDFERDQTKTHSTIALTDAFLQRGEVFKKYQDDVKKIRTQCYKKIVDSEINVAHFYLKKENIKSAQHRLDTLKNEWLDKLPEIKPNIIALEQEVENITNKRNGITLAKKETTPTKIAQATEKRSLAQRF